MIPKRTANECQYSLSFSQAIKRCNHAGVSLQKALQETDRVQAREAGKVLNEAIEINQKAVTDLIRLRREHQASCAKCGSRETKAY